MTADDEDEEELEAAEVVVGEVEVLVEEGDAVRSRLPRSRRFGSRRYCGGRRWQRHQRHGRLKARQRGRRHRRRVRARQSPRSATAGDVILRVLDLVLLLSGAVLRHVPAGFCRDCGVGRGQCAEGAGRPPRGVEVDVTAGRRQVDAARRGGGGRAATERAEARRAERPDDPLSGAWSEGRR